MRNGDCYKIQSMVKLGVSDSDIVKHFRHRYAETEVLRFLPEKKKAKKKPVEKESE